VAPIAAVAVWRLGDWLSGATTGILSLVAVVLIGMYLGEQEADVQDAERKAVLARNAGSAALPGPRMEAAFDRPSVRDVVEAGHSRQ
jgi:hypothetical protein